MSARFLLRLLAILLTINSASVYSVLMSNPEQKLTRAELHNMLWTRPFVRLAKDLGYSYLGVVVICADLNIPRPSGGHWYRLARGGAEDPAPLPPASPGKPTEIPLGPRHGHHDAPPSEPIAKTESVEAEEMQDVPAERKKRSLGRNSL